MPVLFVSHSSKDDAMSAGWRRGCALTALPIFSSTISSIAGGDKWREALRASAGACRVVICLVTENWLASQECFGEFAAACYMGKRVIPLFLLQRAADALATSQEPARKGHARRSRYQPRYLPKPGRSSRPRCGRCARTRLKDGLRAAGAMNEVGLDPQAYTIDPKLRPIAVPRPCFFWRR